MADELQARPSPEQMLERARAETNHTGGPAHGRLKIFFGMAPGVGKTYAMLAAAQRMAGQGVDVAVGVAETHGRAETEHLLLGLDILPRRKVRYTGSDGASVKLAEFDAQAALTRRPDILLVDELAHTNAPGSKHEKRWQDVIECLRAGINVYTTLNVQHLESLNDVVAQITGVAVNETVPDDVFDHADEIELVDLPVEALHDRLKAGKVYAADNAARAVDPSDGFFRKGNLTALRELALRRTAAWVDSDLRRYKQDRGIRAVWPANERIVVAVSPSPLSGKLIRAAKRMAAGLHAELLAVYVETPRTANLTAADRARLAENLRLAESLGAVTATLSGPDAAKELVAYARAHDATRIVAGKTTRSRWREVILGSFIANLIRQSGDIDIYVVRGDEAAVEPVQPQDTQPVPHDAADLGARLRRYGLALASVAVVTLVGQGALTVVPMLDPANVAMMFLVAVVASALWLGRGPAIVAAVAGVAAFDFFFVPPRLTFAVSDVQYLLTFGVMIAVGLIVATLAARTREQASRAADRERRTAALYALSRELAAAQDAHQVAAVGARHLRDTLSADVIIAVPSRSDGASEITPLAHAGEPDWFSDGQGREKSVAQWVLDNGKPAGIGTQKLPSSAGRYVPLRGGGGGGRIGVLALHPRDEAASRTFLDPASQQLLDALASQVASALERVNLGEREQLARVDAERERLRSALLSSVSHDLRTPLASITGAATALQQSGDVLDAPTRESLLRTVVQESARLSDLIANLVFATRLEAGGITLRKEWTTVEEIVGVGLASHRDQLARRPFRVQLPLDLPMIRVDNAMLPQVVHNLVENALRYTPDGTSITLSAWAEAGVLTVKVADEGPGLTTDESAKVFQRFYRGRATTNGQSAAASPPHATGMGLGLTICEGIVKAHNGRIWAEPNIPRGVAFLFSLPVDRDQPSPPPSPPPPPASSDQPQEQEAAP